ELRPYVGLVNAQSEKLKNISDDELRGQTAELKGIINERLKVIDEEMASLHQKVEDQPDMDIADKEDIFNEIDRLEKNRDEKPEEGLLEILPRALAVVKETARRFAENGKLTVQATMMDKLLASKKPNVEISGDTAIWHNKWTASNIEVVWNMV